MAADFQNSPTAKQGRFAALVIAGTGLFWIAAIVIGEWLALPERTRALLDLIALAGFVFALVLIFRIWRARQEDKG
ncbi:DUF5337 domain-containing protein [Shimia marina]|uniref:Uncharacterized protein n=1 Tax=Shimia marina TaxID=321267 RepID=A0A0N7LRF3_9RHOB|nr:DUF5337 domain-containing protein [Shimia marina]CUH50660.1 hypothetical protein SHM7688_00087 [Shimia marina]SFE37499.1 hypothetical protein SAMN04488037_108108 [Shimia marina]